MSLDLENIRDCLLERAKEFMEMPEGWKRWKNNTNLLALDDEIWIRKWEKDFVANLMKEMAEALEVCRLGERIFDEKREEYLTAQDLAQIVLKKFMEWK